MKRVFVCSEYQGSVANLALAMKFCKYVSMQDHAAFAPHLLYPNFLNEEDPKARALGIESGCSWLKVSDEMWVFVRNGVLSGGMLLEIGRAVIYKVHVRYFDYCESTGVITEMRHVRTDKIPTKAELLTPDPFAKQAAKSFRNVSAALSKGVKYEDLQGEIDKVLGPIDDSRNEELDAEWEEQYRQDRD